MWKRLTLAGSKVLYVVTTSLSRSSEFNIEKGGVAGLAGPVLDSVGTRLEPGHTRA